MSNHNKLTKGEFSSDAAAAAIAGGSVINNGKHRQIYQRWQQQQQQQKQQQRQRRSRNNWFIWQATKAEENRTQNSLRAETVNIKGGGGSTQCCLTYWQQKQEYQKGKKEINKRLNKKQCDIRFLKKPSMKVGMHSARLDRHCLRSWGKPRKVLITQAHDFRCQKYDT